MTCAVFNLLSICDELSIHFFSHQHEAARVKGQEEDKKKKQKGHPQRVSNAMAVGLFPAT